MQHLTPVGLGKDGKSLILVSNAGEEFAVLADHRLRAALRGDRARLGQLEMKMESALRPRDIQARIRGGESAEDVAAAAQTTVDAIMGFAAPVLAERAHVAQNAQKSSVRRRSTEAAAAGRTLDQAARTHFSTVGVRADDVEWDAWRREDGRWALVAAYSAGGSAHRAEFTYDQRGRYVVADNEEARLLTGEAVPAGAAGSPNRRLSSVPHATSTNGLRTDEELPLGDDAIELVREREREAAAAREGDAPAREAAADEAGTDEARVDEPDVDDVTADHADADWIAERPADGAAPVEESIAPDQSAEDVAPAADAEDAPATPPASRTRPAKQKKGRSSVPSWDEIMFGGGKSE